jgi:alpha-galactosidase
MVDVIRRKFVVIGAGSVSFGLMTILDLMSCPELRGSDIVLVDIAPDRLERMTRLAQRLNETQKAEFRITSTVDRTEALPGADVVVLAVERDRYRLWNMDRDIPRKHGVIQIEAENGGPGGMFHTFRQVPVILDIARDIERLCPEAWLVNMSNPESRLTLLLYRYTKVKNVGVCAGAYITQHTLATQVLGLSVEDVDVKAAGINHCHWVMDIRRAGTGEDLYPAVRERIEAMGPEWQPLSCECLRRFGYYPGPEDGHVSEYLSWGPPFIPRERAERSNMFAREAEVQIATVDELLERPGPINLDDLKPLMLEGAIRWQTIDIIRSLLDNGNRYILSLNIPNDGCITNLKRDAVVEVPAIVGADRIYGLVLGDLPPAIAAVLELQLRIMDMVVEAAVTGDRRLALQALIVDPACPDPVAAEKILDEMLIAQAEYLPQFA